MRLTFGHVVGLGVVDGVRSLPGEVRYLNRTHQCLPFQSKLLGSGGVFHVLPGRHTMRAVCNTLGADSSCESPLQVYKRPESP